MAAMVGRAAKARAERTASEMQARGRPRAQRRASDKILRARHISCLTCARVSERASDASTDVAGLSTAQRWARSMGRGWQGLKAYAPELTWPHADVLCTPRCVSLPAKEHGNARQRRATDGCGVGTAGGAKAGTPIGCETDAPSHQSRESRSRAARSGGRAHGSHELQYVEKRAYGRANARLAGWRPPAAAVPAHAEVAYRVARTWSVSWGAQTTLLRIRLVEAREMATSGTADVE